MLAPHRFRNMLVVDLLVAGVPLDRVSILLGHQYVRDYREDRRGGIAEIQ
jgi:hypothetical protein